MSTRRNVGEIIKRGSIFYIRYYDGRGRRRLETTKSSKREDAEKQLRKRLSAKDAGVLPEAAIGSLTLKEATDDLIADYKTNKRKSLRDVQGKITMHLLPFFGEKRRMVSIGTPEIRRFIAERQREDKDADGRITKRGAKPAEINRELAALRRAFNLAVQAGRLINRPHFPMLKERNTRRGFLDRDQIDRICAALEATDTAKDQRKRAGELANVVRFAFATGWRTTSEVLPLEWRHVDWKGRCIRLDAHTTKNDEGRSFPFTADLEQVLTEQLAIHERLKATGTICPFVFHRNGVRIGYFRSAWRNACKAAGCPGALVHDMRRSAVRTFERAGVPRSVAMSIVGHKTESIYRRYAIVDEAMQREAAARLDDFSAAGGSVRSSGVVRRLRIPS
jgi:integrase